jgi:hypothetical protein
MTLEEFPLSVPAVAPQVSQPFWADNCVENRMHAKHTSNCKDLIIRIFLSLSFIITIDVSVFFIQGFFCLFFLTG